MQKKMIALSAILATSTAFAALAQDATTTPDGTATTPPPAGTMETDTTSPTDPTMPPATTDGTTGTGMTGTDTTGTTGTGTMGTDTMTGGTDTMTTTGTGNFQVPEGYTLYAGEPMTAEDLRDADVYSTDDESLGSISDFALAEDGRIEQVIFDVGGFLGIGARNVAVPFEELQIYTAENQSDVRVYIPMTREELEALPEYTATEN